MEAKSTRRLRWAGAALVVLALAAVCAIALPQSAWADSEEVTGTNAVNATLTSLDGTVTYTVQTEAVSTTTATRNGTVRLNSVSSAREGDYAICDTVYFTSGGRTYTYDVTSIRTSAINSATNITSLYIPASIADTSSLYLYQCASLGSIVVDENNTSLCVSDNILFNAEMSMLIASIPNNEALGGDEGYVVPGQTTRISDYAFYGCPTLKGIRFEGDLVFEDGSGYAIGENAFAGCTGLGWVDFPAKVRGIAPRAFLDCTSLVSVDFPDTDDCVVYSKYSYAIGADAFSGCTSLEFVSLPAMLGGSRRSDYYFDCSRYYPFTSFFIRSPVGQSAICSGYTTAGLFGGTNIIHTATMAGGTVFGDCTSLKTIVFRAGAPEGMTPYASTGNYASGTAMISGCDNFESFVFEAANQPYYMDPNRSVSETIYRDYWGDAEPPGYYYAVDYYLTDDLADIVAEGYPAAEIPDAGSDDIYVVADLMAQYFEAEDRMARVEYVRDTPTSAIATSDAEVLAGCMYADAAAYASGDVERYSDGVVPDPNEAAAAAGLDTSRAWVWKLSNTQSRREGLSESCSAYLAPADDLSAGRVAADQIAVEYKLCDQNLSRGYLPAEDGDGFVFSEDVGFDVERYLDQTWSDYNFGQNGAAIANFADGDTAWFTLKTSLDSFYDQIAVVAADGTVLDPSTYETSFQRYDGETGGLVGFVLGEEYDGPLLMTVTPGEDSGYGGVLQEWVLVQGHAGTVKSLFTDNSVGSGATWYYATYYNGPGYLAHVSFGSYTASVSSDADAGSALLAAGYAGLLGAQIRVIDSSRYDDFDAFMLANEGTGLNFPVASAGLEDCAARAVAFYDAFERRRSNIGALESDYPWGDTAVLVAPGFLDTTAAAASAYAYAMHAPVFFAEADDATVSDDTLSHLAGFDRVAVIGDEKTFSDAALGDLAFALDGDAEVVRITGDAGSACELAVAVADDLMAAGIVDASTVTVTDASDVFDVVGVLNLSGHEGGIALVSSGSADTKVVSSYLREHRDDVSMVRLYGRNDGTNALVEPFNLENSLASLWSSSYSEPSVEAGDVIVLWGVGFAIGGDAAAGWTIEPLDGFDQEGKPTIEAGDYAYNDAVYTLAATINPAADDPDPGIPDDPYPGSPDDPDPGTTDDPEPDTSDTPHAGGTSEPDVPSGTFTPTSAVDTPSTVQSSSSPITTTTGTSSGTGSTVTSGSQSGTGNGGESTTGSGASTTTAGASESAAGGTSGGTSSGSGGSSAGGTSAGSAGGTGGSSGSTDSGGSTTGGTSTGTGSSASSPASSGSTSSNGSSGTPTTVTSTTTETSSTPNGGSGSGSGSKDASSDSSLTRSGRSADSPTANDDSSALGSGPLNVLDALDAPPVDEAIEPDGSYDDAFAGENEESADSSSVAPAVVAGVVGAVCVAALALALWYAMRRRKSATPPIGE